MARAVNVILESTGHSGKNVFNVNNDGLVSMKFDRLLGRPDNKESEFLSRIDLTLFDKSGYKVLSYLQDNKSKVRVRYGFDNDLSEVYELQVNKLNTTYNNLGCMVAIGAIGTSVKRKFPSMIYTKGTIIDDILKEIVDRNGWDAGENYININTNRLVLHRDLLKEEGETDMDFIFNQLLPICNMSGYTPNASYVGKIWDARLYDTGGASARFIFKPFFEDNVHSEDLRVWKYSYGNTTNSNVLSLTNTIDYSFLVQGLTIQVPALAIESVAGGVVTEEYLGNLIYGGMWENIAKQLRAYGLPEVDMSEYRFNVEIIPAEDSEAKTVQDIETRVYNAIRNVIVSLNTISLSVIGNPKILPTDIIDLTVSLRPDEVTGDYIPHIATGLWKVVTIREEVGLTGFKTVLGLVRYIVEDESITYEEYNKEKSQGGSSSSTNRVLADLK